MENIETRASRLVKRLAVVETQEHHSKAIGFNQGPKKNGKIVIIDVDARGSLFINEINNDIRMNIDDTMTDLCIPNFMTKVFLPVSLSPSISGIFIKILTAVNNNK